jgi:hypothetical protein
MEAVGFLGTCTCPCFHTHAHTHTQTRQDGNGPTSLIIAIAREKEAAAEALLEATVSAGALDKQVSRERPGRRKREMGVGREGGKW